MALDRAGLVTALESAFESLSAQKPEGDPPATANDAATAIADAIDAYVKTAIATVSIPPGSVVVAAAPIAAPVLNPLPIQLTGGPTTVPAGGLS